MNTCPLCKMFSFVSQDYVRHDIFASQLCKILAAEVDLTNHD